MSNVSAGPAAVRGSRRNNNGHLDSPSEVMGFEVQGSRPSLISKQQAVREALQVAINRDSISARALIRPSPAYILDGEGFGPSSSPSFGHNSGAELQQLGVLGRKAVASGGANATGTGRPHSAYLSQQPQPYSASSKLRPGSAPSLKASSAWRTALGSRSGGGLPDPPTAVEPRTAAPAGSTRPVSARLRQQPQPQPSSSGGMASPRVKKLSPYLNGGPSASTGSPLSATVAGRPTTPGGRSVRRALSYSSGLSCNGQVSPRCGVSAGGSANAAAAAAAGLDARCLDAGTEALNRIFENGARGSGSGARGAGNGERGAGGGALTADPPCLARPRSVTVPNSRAMVGAASAAASPSAATGVVSPSGLTRTNSLPTRPRSGKVAERAAASGGGGDGDSISMWEASCDSTRMTKDKAAPVPTNEIVHVAQSGHRQREAGSAGTSASPQSGRTAASAASPPPGANRSSPPDQRHQHHVQYSNSKPSLNLNSNSNSNLVSNSKEHVAAGHVEAQAAPISTVTAVGVTDRSAAPVPIEAVEVQHPSPHGPVGPAAAAGSAMEGIRSIKATSSACANISPSVNEAASTHLPPATSTPPLPAASTLMLPATSATPTPASATPPLPTASTLILPATSTPHPPSSPTPSLPASLTIPLPAASIPPPPEASISTTPTPSASTPLTPAASTPLPPAASTSSPLAAAIPLPPAAATPSPPAAPSSPIPAAGTSCPPAVGTTCPPETTAGAASSSVTPTPSSPCSSTSTSTALIHPISISPASASSSPASHPLELDLSLNVGVAAVSPASPTRHRLACDGVARSPPTSSRMAAAAWSGPATSPTASPSRSGGFRSNLTVDIPCGALLSLEGLSVLNMQAPVQLAQQRLLSQQRGSPLRSSAEVAAVSRGSGALDLLMQPPYLQDGSTLPMCELLRESELLAEELGVDWAWLDEVVGLMAVYSRPSVQAE